MRRTYGKDPLYGLLLTFGAAMVIEEAIRLDLGHARLRPAGAAGDQRRLHLSGSDLVDLSLLRRRHFRRSIIGLVWLFIEKTPYGAIIKAGAHD